MQNPSSLPGLLCASSQAFPTHLWVYFCQVPGSSIAPLPSFSSWCSGIGPRISPSLHPSKSFPCSVCCQCCRSVLVTCDSLFEPQSFTVCLITVQFSYDCLQFFFCYSNNKNKSSGNKPRSAFPFPCLLQFQGANLLHPVFAAPALPALVGIFITVTKIPDINNLVEEIFLWAHSPSWCGGSAGALELSIPGCLCQEAKRRGCLYSWTGTHSPWDDATHFLRVMFPSESSPKNHSHRHIRCVLYWSKCFPFWSDKN